jgi:hypothetical protein
MLNLSTLKAAKALLFATVVAAASQAIPASAETTHTFNAGLSAVTAAQSHSLISTDSSTLKCGVQWSATIPANSSQLWFTYDWNQKNYVNWSVMDETLPDGGPAVSITNVAVDRNSSQYVTYWLTVVNTSNYAKYFQGRYCFQK